LYVSPTSTSRRARRRDALAEARSRRHHRRRPRSLHGRQPPRGRKRLSRAGVRVDPQLAERHLAHDDREDGERERRLRREIARRRVRASSTTGQRVHLRAALFDAEEQELVVGEEERYAKRVEEPLATAEDRPHEARGRSRTERQPHRHEPIRSACKSESPRGCTRRPTLRSEVEHRRKRGERWSARARGRPPVGRARDVAHRAFERGEIAAATERQPRTIACRSSRHDVSEPATTSPTTTARSSGRSRLALGGLDGLERSRAPTTARAFPPLGEANHRACARAAPTRPRAGREMPSVRRRSTRCRSSQRR